MRIEPNITLLPLLAVPLIAVGFEKGLVLIILLEFYLVL